MLCENTALLCCAPYCCCVTAFILYVFVLVLSLGLCCVDSFQCYSQNTLSRMLSRKRRSLHVECTCGPVLAWKTREKKQTS